jgi:hypothetical protein
MRAPSAARIHLDEEIERLIEELPRLAATRSREVNDAVVADDSDECVRTPRFDSLVRLGPDLRRSVHDVRSLVVGERKSRRRCPTHRAPQYAFEAGGSECPFTSAAS